MTINSNNQSYSNFGSYSVSSGAPSMGMLLATVSSTHATIDSSVLLPPNGIGSLLPFMNIFKVGYPLIPLAPHTFLLTVQSTSAIMAKLFNCLPLDLFY